MDIQWQQQAGGLLIGTGAGRAEALRGGHREPPEDSAERMDGPIEMLEGVCVCVLLPL